MRKRSFQFVMYCILTAIFMAGLLTFQILRWVHGVHVYSSEKAWLWEVRTFQISIDVISVIFAFFTFLKKGRKKVLDRDNLLFIFYVLLFTGDLLFSGLDIKTVGIVFYFLAFLVIPFLWNMNIFEIVLRICALIGAPFLSYFISGNTWNFLHIMSIELAALVTLNLVFAIMNVIKKKDLFSIFLLVFVVLAFLANVFICLRAVDVFTKFLKNVFAILVWPIYSVELIMINELYRKY